MSKKAIISEALPTPAGPYSHVVEAEGMVFTCGFGPQSPATGQVPDGIEDQTEQVLRNVATALELVGLSLADVVKTTVHLQEPARDLPGYNRVYERLVPAPYPARTTVGSDLANILVEVDAVAVRPR